MENTFSRSLNLPEFIASYKKHIQPLFQGESWFSLSEENAILEKMKNFFLSEKSPFHRSNLKGHFTASALVFNPKTEKIVLTHHKKLDKWIQLGGHCDGVEDLLVPAMNEAKEESGLKNLNFSPLSMNHNTPLPMDFDIHLIPERGDEPEHLHLDVRFLIETSDELLTLSDESIALKWFSLEEARALTSEENLVRYLHKFELLNALHKNQLKSA